MTREDIRRRLMSFRWVNSIFVMLFCFSAFFKLYIIVTADIYLFEEQVVV